MKLALRKVLETENFHGFEVKEGFYRGKISSNNGKEFLVVTSGIDIKGIIKTYIKRNMNWEVFYINSRDISQINIENSTKTTYSFMRWFGTYYDEDWRSYIKNHPNGDITKIMDEYDNHCSGISLIERWG